jgi:signal transduction histidine kinase
MIDRTEGSTGAGGRRLLAGWRLQLSGVELSGPDGLFLRVVLAIGGLTIAFGIALLLQYLGFREVEVPVVTIAIALITWYLGIGPSVLGVLLATLLFDYFFIDPLYTLDVSAEDLPYFSIFVVWALIVAFFSAIRRRVEANLVRARDHLEHEVAERAQREIEIEKLNRELAKRAGELEAANRELESFAYSVSHDLRAPLRHMVGFSELLQKHSAAALDDKSRRYMQTILDSAKRMGDLIDDLLAFSRIGRAETKKTAVDLNELTRDVVAEARQGAAGREIAWKIGRLPTCYGDRAMLRLVLVNLVANAVKFTRMRKPAEIEIGCAKSEGGEAELFVRDNGAGFDMQYVDKLFGVFQRLHLREEFEGTGIGLATVQRIVHRHGGKVRAEGALDQGATFHFTLPLTAERTA